MKKYSFIVAILFALILGGCIGTQPKYNKDFSNKIIFGKIITVKYLSQANEIINMLNHSTNKSKKFVELIISYSLDKNTDSKFYRHVNVQPKYANILFEMKENSYNQIPFKINNKYVIFYIERIKTKQEFFNDNKRNTEVFEKKIAQYELDYLKEHNKLVEELPKKLETYVQPYNRLLA